MIQIQVGQDTLVFPPETPDAVVQAAVEQYRRENDPNQPSEFEMLTAQQRADADAAKVQGLAGLQAQIAGLRQDMAALAQIMSQSSTGLTQAVVALSATIEKSAQMAALASTMPREIVNPETGKRFQMHTQGRG